MDPEEIIPIGTIGGAHGLKGEVRVRTYNPSSELLAAGMDVFVLGPDKGRRRARIASARRAGKRLLVTFEGVSDRTSAQGLNGSRIAVLRSVLPPLEPGEFYYEDVIGLPVRLAGGEELGRVTSVMNGATDILVIKGDRGEFMIPVVEGFVIEVGPDDVVVGPDALETV
ncbi:MAG: 16S rRNA processing protein RimM [Deltaproteobacteria bacterium]|nr:16S rRNA processing protein RimM [Deltaproteobacteria bacterium]